jgi:2-polyprenyl-6-methoxyphenol hydroxylase-like FAD-dependent oxidoreductase
VSVTADRNGERTSFTAFFVVGCDGAHSSVRHGLGLALEGGECHDSFMLTDIETNEVLPGHEVHFGPSELGPLAIFPISAKRRRIVATIKQPQGGAPSLELVRKTLAERDRGGIEASLEQLFPHSPPECDVEAQGADLHSGDAHIHSPFSGQGMNTDCMTFGTWSGNSTSSPLANDSLLDTYDAERLR